MNMRALLAVMRKDLKVAVQNKGVVLPIVMVPVILFVIFPWAFVFGPRLLGDATNMQSFVSQINHLLSGMPAAMQAQLAGHKPEEMLTIFMLVYGLAPMFLIMPLMAASVLAADSFAGEKERKTLEALLYSPTTDRELFAAKLLGPWAASVVIAWLSFLLYAVMSDLAGWSGMHLLLFPNPMWTALVLWVVPAVAGLGLVVMVFASARAQGFQDAYQTGGMIVLPILALMAGQITGVLYFTVGMVFVLGLVIWLLNVVLLWLASRNFHREQLMPR